MSLGLTSQNLCLSEYSTAEELDMLFNEKDGILADDTFIGIMADGQEELGMDKSFDTDDLFSQLLTADSTHEEPSYDHAYSKDQQLSRSPLYSDSGYSNDSCQRSPESESQRSPEYFLSDSQSEPSPGRSDDGNHLEEVILETVDLSSILTGNDAMLMEDDTVTTTTLESSEEESNSNFIETIGFSSNLKLTASESKKATLPLTVQNAHHCENSLSKYHLVLTDEEKRLLNDMSVSLPTDMPLTKEEERSLKAVRRKIRNKASAQNSRQRKKVYVDGLEHRVQMCTRQNLELAKKMDKLEKENRSLLDQLKSLQSLVTKGSSKAAQASTCVMVLLFSFALLVAPSFNPFSGSQPESYQPSGLVSRTLKNVDVGESGIVHEEPNLGIPPQSDADDNPSMKFGRGMRIQEDFSLDEEIPDAAVAKQTTDEKQTKDDKKEAVVMPPREADIKTVVNSPNNAQRNNSDSQNVVVKTNDGAQTEKVVTNSVETNRIKVETKPKSTIGKHAGDEM